MLPVVVGDSVAARVIFAHTVALVGLSLLPVFFGLGWIYLTGAALGGAYFIAKSRLLVRNPGPPAAMANFFASLVQLGLLQVAAVADRLLLG
jgi:protoheme IX farnesyltransferase